MKINSLLAGTLAFVLFAGIGPSIDSAFAFEGQGTLYATVPYKCELWNIDPSNGDGTFIAETGGGAVNLPSIAVHPFTGVMYGGGGGSNVGDCDNHLGNNLPNLYEVDPVTGDTTLVGATNEGNLVGLDFRKDGTLFAAVKTPGGPSGGSALGIVNTATGDTTIVGPFGFGEISGIAFIGNTLYGVSYNDELYIINTSTGAATVAADVDTEIDLGAAQFACDFTLYVGEGSVGDEFGTVDITTGEYDSIADGILDETIGGFSFTQTCNPVGGSSIPIDSTSLILSGTQLSAAWLIPAIISAVGIGLVISRKI